MEQIGLSLDQLLIRAAAAAWIIAVTWWFGHQPATTPAGHERATPWPDRDASRATWRDRSTTTAAPLDRLPAELDVDDGLGSRL